MEYETEMKIKMAQIKSNRYVPKKKESRTQYEGKITIKALINKKKEEQENSRKNIGQHLRRTRSQTWGVICIENKYKNKIQIHQIEDK